MSTEIETGPEEPAGAAAGGFARARGRVGDRAPRLRAAPDRAAPAPAVRPRAVAAAGVRVRAVAHQAPGAALRHRVRPALARAEPDAAGARLLHPGRHP